MDVAGVVKVEQWSDSVIKVRNLTFQYDGTHVLNGIDLDVSAGEIVSLVGPSGSGKTTLLYCLAGIIRGWEGSIRIGGRSLAELADRELSDLRATECGYVLQFGRLIPELTALENVTLPLRILRIGKSESRRQAESMLDQLGVAHLSGSKAATMSGGEQQRVAVARALVHSPAVVFADEPTGALDSRNSARVMDLMVSQARQQGSAIVLVTHERRVAEQADRIVEMTDGTLWAGGDRVGA